MAYSPRGSKTSWSPPGSPKTAAETRKLSTKLETERRSGRIADLLLAYREDRLDEHLNRVAVDAKKPVAPASRDKARFRSLPGHNSKYAPPKGFKARGAGVGANKIKTSDIDDGKSVPMRKPPRGSSVVTGMSATRGIRGVPTSSSPPSSEFKDRRRAQTSSGRFFAVQKRVTQPQKSTTTPKFEKMMIEQESKEHELLRKAEELRRRESNIRRRSEEVRSKEQHIVKKAGEMNEELKAYAQKTGQMYLEKFCKKCGKRREMTNEKPAKFCVSCGYTFTDPVIPEDATVFYDDTEKRKQEEESKRKEDAFRLLEDDLKKRENKMKRWEDMLAKKENEMKKQKQQERVAEETSRKLKEQADKRKIKQKEEAMRTMEEELQKREKALQDWENAVKAAQEQEAQKSNEAQQRKFEDLARLEQEAEQRLQEAKQREEKLKKAEADLKKLMDAADASKRLDATEPDWTNLPSRRTRTIQSIVEEDAVTLANEKELELEKAKAALQQKKLKKKEAEMKQDEIRLKKKLKKVEKLQKTLSAKTALNMSALRNQYGDRINCQNCDGDVSREQNFCDTCGAKVIYGVTLDVRDATRRQLDKDLKCPKCEEQILSTSKFCKHCGCKISSQTDPQRGRKGRNRTRSRRSRASSLEREPGFNDLVQTAQSAENEGIPDALIRSRSMERNTKSGRLAKPTVKTEAPAVHAAKPGILSPGGGHLQCSKCSTNLPKYFKFCDICGTPL